MQEKFAIPDYYRRTPSRALGLALRYTVMTALIGVFIGPFLWMFLIALREGGNIYQLTISFNEMTLSNFIEVSKMPGFRPAFLNSVLVAAMVVSSNILFCSLAAYPLARMEFPGSRLIFLVILGTLMVPFHLYMIPLYLLCVKVGLFDSLVGIAVPTAVGAFGIYLIKQYYHTIPKDLEEAARIDGASEFGIWWRIMFPLTKPAIAALGIFIFVGNWSSFLWPLLIISSEGKYTLPIAVAKLSGAFVDKSQYVAAGSVIAVAPVIVLFFFLQRYFIGGITLGSVKG